MVVDNQWRVDGGKNNQLTREKKIGNSKIDKEGLLIEYCIQKFKMRGTNEVNKRSDLR